MVEGSREDRESWQKFLQYPKVRGLHSVKLFVSDKSTGPVEVLGDFFHEANWQQCVVHWYRNAFAKCPKRKNWLVAAMTQRKIRMLHAKGRAGRQKTPKDKSGWGGGVCGKERRGDVVAHELPARALDASAHDQQP